MADKQEDEDFQNSYSLTWTTLCQINWITCVCGNYVVVILIHIYYASTMIIIKLKIIIK